MLHQQTTRFVGHFMGAYPVKSATMVGMLVVAGFLEGIGVLTMLPLLEMAAGGDGAEPSALSVWLSNALGAVGLAPSIGLLLAIIVTAITAKAVLIWLAMRQVGHTVAQVTTDLRLELLRTLMQARWSYYTSQPGGEFANAISNEAHRAAAAYRSACVVIAGGVQVLAYLTVAYLVSWRVALATLAIGGVFLFLLRGVIQLAREAGSEQTDLMRSLVARLTDALRGIKPVRAMGREDQVLPLLERETEALNQALRKQVDASEALRLFQEPTLTAFLALGLFLALVVGDQPLASVLVLAFIFYRLMTQVNTLQMRYQVTTVGESAFWSLQRQIDEARRQREPARGALPPPPLVRGIHLQDVTFRYEDVPVLRDLTLEIPAGAFVALYGPSGAGKTTIADLILGLHRPSAGTVEVDGVPLEDVDISAWRKQVGYVPQEVFLFHDSVLRNVTLGDESISRESAERALRGAGVWSVVESRPEGMDEVLGEGGAKLSGGQRQRVSIARALVHQPKLLILDEATTALDPATELAILETLQRLQGDVTILAISHQPALSEAADIVYSLERGKVTEVSTESARIP